MRFTELRIDNFRAWEHLTIPFRPITLIFGPNNSGKSSILSTLVLLAQTVTSGDRDVPLLLNGPYLDLGTYSDVVFMNDKRRSILIQLSIALDREADRRWARIAHVSPVILEATFRFRSQRRQIVLASSTLYDTYRGEERAILSTRYSSREDAQMVASAIQSTDTRRSTRVNSRAVAMNHFMVPPVAQRPSTTSERRELGEVLASRHIEAVQSVFTNALQSLEYLGAFRQKPSRTYLFAGQSPRSVGSGGEWATDILVADYLRRGTERTNVLENVSEWMKKASLANEIEVKPLSDRHFEIRVKHPVTGETQNIADAGSGLSQILPVLVAGYWADPGSTLVLEEPEIHLHPKAQAEWGEFVLDLYRRRVQVLAETHSEHLILRIQRLIAEGKIPPDDVAVYYVCPQSGAKTISRIRLSEGGHFADEWPNGFFPERLQEARAILQGAAGRSSGRNISE